MENAQIRIIRILLILIGVASRERNRILRFFPAAKMAYPLAAALSGRAPFNAYLMLKAPNQKRAIRLDNLGDLYSLDCLYIRIQYHTGKLQSDTRLSELQKAYGFVLGETISLKREGKNRPQSPDMPDVHRLAVQLAVINRDGLCSIGEVEGKMQAYRADCLRIASEIERLDRAADDFEERLAGMRIQYEKAKQQYDVYCDIVQTYREISQGDYISKRVEKERKRQDAEKSRRKKNVVL